MRRSGRRFRKARSPDTVFNLYVTSPMGHGGSLNIGL